MPVFLRFRVGLLVAGGQWLLFGCFMGWLIGLAVLLLGEGLLVVGGQWSVVGHSYGGGWAGCFRFRGDGNDEETLFSSCRLVCLLAGPLACPSLLGYLLFPCAGLPAGTPACLLARLMASKLSKSKAQTDSSILVFLPSCF